MNSLTQCDSITAVIRIFSQNLYSFRPFSFEWMQTLHDCWVNIRIFFALPFRGCETILPIIPNWSNGMDCSFDLTSMPYQYKKYVSLDFLHACSRAILNTSLYERSAIRACLDRFQIIRKNKFHLTHITHLLSTRTSFQSSCS